MLWGWLAVVLAAERLITANGDEGHLNGSVTFIDQDSTSPEIRAPDDLQYISSAEQEEQRVCTTDSCKADDMALHCEADAKDLDDQEDENDSDCECTCQNEPENECATACPGECAVTLADLQQIDTPTPEPNSRRLTTDQQPDEDTRMALLSAVAETLHARSQPVDKLSLGPVIAHSSLSLASSWPLGAA
eukprot:jgi/Ulvmu1/8525/UM044_0059.1